MTDRGFIPTGCTISPPNELADFAEAAPAPAKSGVSPSGDASRLAGVPPVPACASTLARCGCDLRGPPGRWSRRGRSTKAARPTQPDLLALPSTVTNLSAGWMSTMSIAAVR